VAIGKEVMENLLVYVSRLILCAVLLSYASIQDVLKREVSNKVWLVGIPSCLVLDFIDFYFGNIGVVSFFASLAVGLLLGFALFYLGFYGGADSKALMLISMAVPSYLPGAASLVTMVFPLPTMLIFFCSTLFTVFYPLTILALNLVDLCKGKYLLKGIEEKNDLKRLFLYGVVRRIRLEDFEKSLKLFPEREGRLGAQFCGRKGSGSIGKSESLLNRHSLGKTTSKGSHKSIPCSGCIHNIHFKCPHPNFFAAIFEEKAFRAQGDQHIFWPHL
jgi:Flp pilus assembly protein protease CpaA